MRFNGVTISSPLSNCRKKILPVPSSCCLAVSLRTINEPSLVMLLVVNGQRPHQSAYSSDAGHLFLSMPVSDSWMPVGRTARTDARSAKRSVWAGSGRARWSWAKLGLARARCLSASASLSCRSLARLSVGQASVTSAELGVSSSFPHSSFPRLWDKFSGRMRYCRQAFAATCRDQGRHVG